MQNARKDKVKMSCGVNKQLPCSLFCPRAVGVRAGAGGGGLLSHTRRDGVTCVTHARPRGRENIVPAQLGSSPPTAYCQRRSPMAVIRPTHSTYTDTEDITEDNHRLPMCHHRASNTSPNSACTGQVHILYVRDAGEKLDPQRSLVFAHVSAHFTTAVVG